MAELIETIEVELVDGGARAVINKTDFNPTLHREVSGDEPTEPKPKKAKAKDAEKSE